jgi:hypothetical protein
MKYFLLRTQTFSISNETGAILTPAHPLMVVVYNVVNVTLIKK